MSAAGRAAPSLAAGQAARSGVAALLCSALVVAGCAAPASPTPAPMQTPPATRAPTPSSTPRPTPSPTPSPTPIPTLGPEPIALRAVATELASPLHVADAGDVPGRLYVVEQGGRIRIVDGGVGQPTPFLDISDRVRSGGERGLLSVAFPADYAGSGRFFVDYTDRNGDTVIARYERSDDGSTADPASERILLSIDQPYANHNGGLVIFGSDGYLYVGMGDGGSGGDPMNNGQRGDTLLGKLLRLDVGGDEYEVPSNNPFVGDPAIRDEIWALGLRNPWRFSFDRESGDLWLGDVGQATWEEIDFQSASSRGGENYGWARMEGPDCYRAACDPSAYVLPVASYRHGEGDCTVVGGYVYRGSAFPELRGTYLFGDYCTGRIWGLPAAAAASGAAEARLFLDSDLFISSFGEDGDGELYVTDLSGGVYQVIRSP